MLDRGGLFASGANPSTVQYTPAYLPADVYRALQRGELPVPDDRWVIHAWGRSLLSAIANREVLAGYMYRTKDFSCEHLARCSEYLDCILDDGCKTLQELVQYTEETISGWH
jgi:hypothetical protein